jgi:hypothetical protein
VVYLNRHPGKQAVDAVDKVLQESNIPKDQLDEREIKHCNVAGSSTEGGSSA